MLVLTRRVGQKVVLLCGGETIEIEFRRNQHGGIRLGFEANPEVKIWRKELIDRDKERDFINRREIGK